MRQDAHKGTRGRGRAGDINVGLISTGLVIPSKFVDRRRGRGTERRERRRRAERGEASIAS